MPALIFDLDGTLIDKVHAHVFSWQRATEAGIAREPDGEISPARG